MLAPKPATLSTVIAPLPVLRATVWPVAVLRFVIWLVARLPDVRLTNTPPVVAVRFKAPLPGLSSRGLAAVPRFAPSRAIGPLAASCRYRWSSWNW